MNPYSSPQAELDEADCSVLAVYERRRDKLIFAVVFMASALLFFLSAIQQSDHRQTIIGLVVGAVATVISAWLIFAGRHRTLVSAIGQQTLTLILASRGRVALQRTGILLAEWVDRYNEGPDTLVLVLSEEEWLAVGHSPLWSRRSAKETKVEYAFPDGTVPTRLVFRQTLDEWLAERKADSEADASAKLDLTK